jgi:hypothetical protein
MGVLAAFLILGGVLATAHLFQTPSVVHGQQASVVENSPTQAGSTASPGNSSPAKKLPTKQVTPNANNSASKVPSVLQPSSGDNATSNATPPAATFMVKDTTLDGVTQVCSAQHSAYAAQTAKITMSDAPHGSGVIRWYWETRVDGGEATDNPPVSTQVYTQTVASGSQPIILQNADPQTPLITAPTSSNYSYSFRLHVTGPTDIVSDWVSVPVVLDNSCQ